MPVLNTAVDPRAPGYLRNRSTTLERVDAINSAIGRIPGTRCAGTGWDGGLPARARLELLVDRDAPLLELSPPVAGPGRHGGCGVVTAIGVVRGCLCVIVADDPAAGDPADPVVAAKTLRAVEVAEANDLPLVRLLDRPGPMGPGSLYPESGVCVALARRSASGAPTIAVVCTEPEAAAVIEPGIASHTIVIRDRALGQVGQPDRRVRPEGYRGAADYVAEDEREAVRLAREVTGRLGRTVVGPGYAEPPRYRADGLLALAPADPATPADPHEILARVLDGSRFEEFDSGGPALATGWGSIHGYPVAVLADGPEPPGRTEARRAAQLVRLADAAATPVLLLRCAGEPRGRGTGPADRGTPASVLVAALANARVPHLTVHAGAGRAMGDSPRFRFRWPSGRSGGARHGECADDGVIDPRDTRPVLGMCLAVIAGGSAAREAAGGAYRQGGLQ